MTLDDPVLVVHLNGPGWRAELVVAAPNDDWRRVEFDVPLSTGRNPHRQSLFADVRYTVAENKLGTGWELWHVKLYRCATLGEAEALRRYLVQQAAYIQQANHRLPRASRIPIEPPWSVVPVHVVRCGGGPEDIGPVRTQLAASLEEIAGQLQRALPSWLLTDVPPQPERYLLAISPFMEPLNWVRFHDAPATEHLRDFLGMAAGLDALHELGTVHCDIKPDNVCRYNTHEVTGFVLIDTDSVTPVDPPPRSLRPTRPYHHKAITDWFENPKVTGYGIDAGILKAHDRFGFAVLVLTALAGREWVDRTLLRPVEGARGSGGERRIADDRHAVRQALTAHWPDSPGRSWGPLIDALVEPFGPEIELDHWSATDWAQRLLQAEHACVIEKQKPPLFPTGDGTVHRDSLDAIRRLAMSVPTTRPSLMEQQGYGAIEQVAYEAARRAAARRLAGCLIGTAVIVFLLLFTAFR